MAQEFHYVCSSCENNIPVTVKMAGMAINCPQCSTANELPGMREIKQLSPVSVDSPNNSALTGRNETRSWLFSGGLLLAVIAGASAWGLGWYANSLVTESKLDNQIEFGKSQIDLLPAGHLWDAWDGMTANGLPDWAETGQVRYNKQAGHLSNIAYALYGLSGFGVLAMISSFFLSRKPKH